MLKGYDLFLMLKKFRKQISSEILLQKFVRMLIYIRLYNVYPVYRYQTINLNLSSKPQWFLDKNPLGKVPTVLVSSSYSSTYLFS